jgi:hypothetical protein
MSGTLGAIATASVSANRQAEGWGAGAAGSAAGLPGVSCPTADPPGFVADASTGRGFGKGTAAATPACPQNASISAVAVTIAALRPPHPRQGHLRRAFDALNFVTIPQKNRGKRSHIFGGTSVCLG